MHTYKIYLPAKEGDVEINYHRKLVQIKHIEDPVSASKENCKISISQRYIIHDDYISTSALRFLLNIHSISVVRKADNKYHVIGNVRLYSIVKARVNNTDFRDNEKIPVIIIDSKQSSVLSTFSILDSYTAALLYSYGKKPFTSIGLLTTQIEHKNLEACFCEGIGGSTKVGSNNYISKVFNVKEPTLGLTIQVNGNIKNEISEIKDIIEDEENKVDLHGLNDESKEALGDAS